MLNHIVIMGRLTRDPELRRTGSGIAVANFTVAVDRDFADKQSGEKETDFFDCVAWRQTGEFVSKYFKKGSMVAISGRLQTRSWNDKDGNKRKAFEILAENAYFGESKKESGQTGGGYSAPAYPEAEQALNRYGGQQGYAAPQFTQGDFAMLDDDDAQLPF